MKLDVFFQLITLFSILSCRPPIEITTDQDPNFELSDYETFGFVAPDSLSEDGLGSTYQDELNLIKEEIKNHLEARGLNYKGTNPELHVNIGIVIDEKIQTRTTNIMSDPPRYMGQRRYTWKAEEVEVGRYQYGTVTIHIIDRSSDELVWLGVGESIVPESEERLEKQIKEGVAELISKVP